MSTETWTPVPEVIETWTAVGEEAPTSTPPVNTTPPVITGSFFVGDLLTVTPGTYTNSPTVTRVWLVGGQETASTGLSFIAQLGSVSVRETAANADGTIQVLSATVTITEPDAPPYEPAADFSDPRNSGLMVVLLRKF